MRTLETIMITIAMEPAAKIGGGAQKRANLPGVSIVRSIAELSGGDSMGKTSRPVVTVADQATIKKDAATFLGTSQ
jgi:hypothetical protein